ncbi:MAG: antibiotic biosynthesis monooxygenase family protein [Bacilli bacterium]
MWAVIFTSRRTEGDDGYGEMATQMVELAQTMPGFIRFDSVRDASGKGITVSYWRDPENIRAWREQTDHQVAQKYGREKWYADYEVAVCNVVRAYGKKNLEDGERE